MQMKLEVVALPVADVDVAKAFSTRSASDSTSTTTFAPMTACESSR